MELPNVMAIAKEMQLFVLLRRLARFGKFSRTPFRQVITGQVADLGAFLEGLEEAARERPGFLDPLQRVMPLHFTFPFLGEEDFRREIGERLPEVAARLPGDRFYVRFARRGVPAASLGFDVEREVGGLLEAELRRQGRTPKVAFADPDAVVTIETAGAAGGIGLIVRELLARPYLKVR